LSGTIDLKPAGKTHVGEITTVATFHILLVDDEKRFAFTLAHLLRARGFDVATAFGGYEALEQITSGKAIDVVVLDVRMPDMDGITTLQRIKQFKPDIEVIMLTGQANLEDGVQAVRQGAFDYLQKPCDIEDILAKIKAACNVEQIRRHQVLWPRTTAGEAIRSGFVPLRPEDSLEDALGIFNRYRSGESARLLFVVDARQRVVGQISKREVLAAVAKEQGREDLSWDLVQRNPECLASIPVHRIMHTGVETVTPEIGLAEVAHRMLALHYESIPVVSEGLVMGVVRLRDALQYLEAADPTSAAQ
jgi:two-component system response regulator HydG